jgi:hypothetical protein
MSDHINFSGVFLALVLVFAMNGAGAADAGKSGTSSEKFPANTDTVQKARTVPVYVPPKRGAPLARVGGGSRGVDDGLPYISVITPDHVGYTSKAQPVLYWYISEDMKTRFEFALINDDDIEPIAEVVSEQQMTAGLNSMNLADQGVTLQPGVAYQWSVALVSDANKRSSDVVSSGQIELITLTAEQQSALDNASEDERVMLLAQEGYWYDTFAGLSELIANDPGNNELRAQRAALLEQIGLPVVSAASR